MAQSQTKCKKFDYKWVIAALCALVVLLAVGVFSSTRSQFLVPITKALGIDRGTYSITDSIRFVTTAIINLFFGALIGKFGAKKLLLAGLSSLIISALCFSFAPNVYVLYIAGLFLGIGFSWSSTTMIGYVINRWFKENKGTIMGAVLAINGLGAAVATPIIAPVLNDESNAFGYKTVYLTVAGIIAGIAVLIAIFFRNTPKDDEGVGAAKAKKKSRGQDWSGISYTAAVKKPYFYGALCCVFLTGFVLQGMSGITAAHLADVGFTTAFVAACLSAKSFILMGSKFFVGFVYDKLGFRTAVNICNAAAVTATLILAIISNSPTGKALALIYCVLDAVALPLETVMLPIYTADLFGQKAYTKILGIFVAVNVAGYAVGGPVMNFFFDTFGSYSKILLVMSIVMAVVMLALQFIISAAKKQRRLVEQSEEKNETAEALKA
jgi:MFS family permease